MHTKTKKVARASGTVTGQRRNVHAMGADDSMEQTRPLQSQIQMSSAFFGRLPRFSPSAAMPRRADKASSSVMDAGPIRVVQWESLPLVPQTAHSTSRPPVYIQYPLTQCPEAASRMSLPAARPTRAPRAMRRSWRRWSGQCITLLPSTKGTEHLSTSVSHRCPNTWAVIRILPTTAWPT